MHSPEHAASGQCCPARTEGRPLPPCSAGARSLLYGSALGVGAVLLLGSFAIRALDVASPAEFKARMQAWADPVALSAQGALLPLKGHIQVGWGYHD